MGGRIILFCGVTCVVLASAFTFCTEYQYRESIELVRQEDYKEAREQIKFLAQIEFKDTDLMMKYCDSRIAYAQGDVDQAKRLIAGYLDELEALFPGAKAYGERIDREGHDAWRKKWEAEHPEDCPEIPDNESILEVPCIGMREEWIGRTRLGRPGPAIRYAYGITEYEFKSEGQTIFEVWCRDGSVTYLVDHRNDSVPEPEPMILPTNQEPEPDDDSYDAKDYSNEFDFYDDNKDNFIDFYAAERYFKKHHD